MFYVIPRTAKINECGHGNYPEAKQFGNLHAAMDEADRLHRLYDNHWHVVKVETVWATTTLDDLKAEGAF